MKIEGARHTLREIETMLTSLKGDVGNTLDYAIEHTREARKDLEDNGQKGSPVNVFGKIGVVCHHSASQTDTVESIRRYHIEEKHWQDIGYHLLIDRSGNLVMGRRWDLQGCHGQNDFNQHYLGLCVLGNFSIDRIPDNQMKTLMRVVAGMSRLFFWDSSHWIGHRDVKEKILTGGELENWKKESANCPGDNFPLAEVRTMADINAKEWVI